MENPPKAITRVVKSRRNTKVSESTQPNSINTYIYTEIEIISHFLNESITIFQDKKFTDFNYVRGET